MDKFLFFYIVISAIVTIINYFIMKKCNKIMGMGWKDFEIKALLVSAFLPPLGLVITILSLDHLKEIKRIFKNEE